MGRVLIYLEGFHGQGVGKTYSRALELCQQVGDTRQRIAALHGLYSFNYSYADKLPIAIERLRLAETEPDVTYQVSAHHLLGNNRMFMGELVAAQEHFARCAALYDPRDHADYLLLCGQDEGVAALANQALNQWLLGYADTALRLAQETVSQAEFLAHPMSLATAQHFLASIQIHRGELNDAHVSLDRLHGLAVEHELAEITRISTLHRCQALSLGGQAEDAIAPLADTKGDLAAKWAGSLSVHKLLILARAYGQLGDYEHGLTWVMEARRTTEEYAYWIMRAETFRLEGELLWALSRTADAANRYAEAAELALRRAVATARHQQALSLELRAAISLSRQWEEQGRIVEAHSLLSTVYGRFSEGFATADLVTARDLLEGLQHALPPERQT